VSGQDGTRAPLAPEWLGWTLPAARAGATATALVRLRNGGTASWRSRGTTGVQLAYHWLDPLGNPVVWDGQRTPFPSPVPPGETVELPVEVTAPRPPGRYRLAFDLVEEHRFWFAELGCPTLEHDVLVVPRLETRRLRAVVHGGDDPATRTALASQEEPVVDGGGDADAVAHLVAGAVPAPDWSRRLLDAHAEGWPAVGPGLVAGRGAAELAPWAAGTGRNPRLPLPLLLPSLLCGLEPGAHLGLPAYDGQDGLFDGRIRVTLPRRSGRRRG
jgi:hypothetical protein